jgi:hypothetical protein
LEWVRTVPSRKLLLLLDEGDPFLDSDAANDFAETRKLKALMDDSGRAIKVVFAGLHNVQRSTTQPNHPLAHLGSAVAIGDFSATKEWMEAYSLIAAPLTALGYTFESVDLPSRVLTACNFYPGLIQQFGHRLLELLRQRPRNDWPCVVTADDIDAVANDEGLRQFMLERFKLTLQLDPRYHYLAYLFALSFHENPKVAEHGMEIDELRMFAIKEKPDRFSGMNREGFATLIDEMKGLGIFQVDATKGRVFLRNTNVLLFLGSRSQILEAVIEDIEAVRYDYQTETCRGRVPHLTANRRRWLTRVQENQLLTPDRNRLTYLSALPMAQSCSLEDSLRGATTRMHNASWSPLLKVDSADLLESRLKTLADKEAQKGLNVVLVQLRHWDAIKAIHDMLLEFVDRRREVRFFSVVVEVPAAIALSRAMSSFLETLHAGDVRHLTARRWEPEFIGAWLQESEAIPTSQQLKEVVSLTDGWPSILHQLVEVHRHTRDWATTISQMSTRIDQMIAATDDFARNALGLSGKDAEFLALLATASDKGSVSFSTEDFDVAADLSGVPAKLAGHMLGQAVRHELVTQRDARFICTPLLSRFLGKT